MPSSNKVRKVTSENYPTELPYKNHVQEKHNIRFVLPSHFAT